MTSDEQRVILEGAREAGASGNVEQLIRELTRSGVLDGLAQRNFWKQFRPDFADEEVDQIIVSAVQALYTALQKGEVRELVAYLWKTATNMAYSVAKVRGRTNRLEDLEKLEGGIEAPAEHGRGDLIDQALVVARRLLPRIGQENVRSVMAFILDQIDEGNPDVTNQQIADELGLNLTSVATWRMRGFDRLQRVAKELGLNPDPALFDQWSNVDGLHRPDIHP